MTDAQMLKSNVAHRAGNVGLLWSTVAMGLFSIFVGGILVAMLFGDDMFRRLPPDTTTTTTTETTTTTTTTSTAAAACLSSLSWTDEIVASENTTIGRNAGEMPSIAVNAGEPYIFHTSRDAPLSLWITQRNGSTWSDAEVDSRVSIDDALRSLSAATVDGLPSAAYRLSATVQLHFAQRNGTANVVTDLESGGSSASMAVADDGHPHIAHYAPNLRLVSRNATAWSGQDVATPGVYFGFVALAFVGGQPAILYQDVTSFGPAASNINSAIFNGATWDITLIELLTTFGVLSGSMANANGTAVAAYDRAHITTDSKVFYATFDGASWSTSAVPGATSDIALMFPSLETVCNKSVLTYCNVSGTDGDLCAVTVLDGTWTTKVTYPAAKETSATSVADLDGFPVAAFKAGLDQSNPTLRYAEASLGP